MSLLALYRQLSTLRAPTWYAVPLRLIVGFGFMEHGCAKLARGPDSFTAILYAIGMPLPGLLAWATITVEPIGGFVVLVDSFIPLASIPMAGVLLVAIFTVHIPNGFSSIKLESFDSTGAHLGQPGYETDLLHLAGLVALVLGAPALSRWTGFCDAPSKPQRPASRTATLAASDLNANGAEQDHVV